ncbi:unnamed protein product [Adineta steineri]|uniref:Myeloid leukemia factor n=1 Tax=Adineta steineri TaxID=433720 RepID=A0A813PKA6_9BILA|nr:unnamed protein product [Adineta steineri]CAF3906100.1 unnamed protein product [Adineta steineri]
MFGFPTDLFGMPNNSNRRTSSNSLIQHQQSLFNNTLMMQPPLFGGMNGLTGDFGIHSSPFSIMNRMMQGVNHIPDSPVHSYTSTTVMSFNGADGRPKVYQETTSRNRGPGGIEETRQAVRDTERGINKVQIGHRIGDRKHVIEREMNVETGQISENVELENLDENETDGFKQEWRQRSTHAGIPRHPHHPYFNHHHQITSNRLHHPSSGSQPAQLAIEQGVPAEASNRSYQKSSASYRPDYHHSDTIDLTEDTPVEDDIQEIQELPAAQSSSAKRKASSSSSSSSSLSNDVNNQRKHRQNRF